MTRLVCLSAFQVMPKRMGHSLYLDCESCFIFIHALAVMLQNLCLPSSRNSELVEKLMCLDNVQREALYSCIVKITNGTKDIRNCSISGQIIGLSSSMLSTLSDSGFPKCQTNYLPHHWLPWMPVASIIAGSSPITFQL